MIEPLCIVIHGGIDGYSCLIVFLHASTNNRATTVLTYFQEAVVKYNLPSWVRCNLGMENLEVARYMLETRGLNRGSIITGTSVHNQRIERLWRDVNRIVISRFLNIFLYLERNGFLCSTNEVHLYCLQLVYLDLVNQALDEFTAQWNSHPVTTETNFSPRQLWVSQMVTLQQSNYTAVQDVLGASTDYSNYGIDEEGPVPEAEEYRISVPPLALQSSADQLHLVQNAINESRDESQNGIFSYLLALKIIHSFIDASA